MSITLRKLARQVIELESGGSQSVDSQLSEAYVILLCRQASNKFLTQDLYARMSQDDRSTLQLMIASYEVTVAGENPNKYITLPEFYINLPFNKGIHGIAPVEDPTNFFIPRQNPSVSFNLPCSDLEPETYSYWTKGMKVYFDNDIDFAKVLVDLVVASPDTIDKDDPLPIYPEHQADLIVMVRQMIANRPLQDKIVDGNPDLGVKIPMR
jgi:hypothetical protein